MHPDNRLTKQLKEEVLRVYHTYWGAYLRGDMKTFAAYLDEKVHTIGTAAGEVFRNKREALRFYTATADQMTGKAELRNQQIRMQPVPEGVLTTEESDLYVKTGRNWVLYGPVRITALLHRGKEGWKLLHQHASFPDRLANTGEQIGTEKLKKENSELREAVQRRTKELEEKSRELAIDAALERVRTMAMGMKEPADMLKICRTISQQLQKLGVTEIRNVQTAVINQERGSYLNYEFFDRTKKEFITLVNYTGHKDVNAFVKRIINDPDAFFTKEFAGKKLKDWIAYQRKAGQYVDPHTAKAQALHYYFYAIAGGALGISSYAPLSNEEIGLFKRFRNVFELSYRRFIDIEQAVAQAREAQIEAALERVRTAAMAMRSSAEIGSLIFQLYGELTRLDARLDRCFIMIVNPDNNGITWWMAGQEGLLAENGFFVQPNEHPSHQMYLRYSRQRKKKWTYLFQGKEKRDWDRFGFGKTELARLPEPVKKFMAAAKKVHLSGSSDQFGSLVTGSFEPLPDEQQDILSRFAIVFNQTYTRFLDLQKAEAQAREAEIQLALERVRARSLAMHHTSELQEVANIAASQLHSIGMDINGGVFICINAEQDKQFSIWASGGMADYVQKVQVPELNEPIFTSARNAIKKGNSFLIETYTDREKQGLFKHLFQFEPWKSLPKERKKELLARKGGFARSIVISQHTSISITNHHGKAFSGEENEILKRFGKVFEQSYIRFLDLQKAEAQAKEAQIEAALERVRARAMAMHSSNELNEVVHELRLQMGLLGQKGLETCVIHLYDESPDFIHSWAAIKPPEASGEILESRIKFPKKGLLIIEEAMNAYDSGRQDYIVRNEGKKLEQWFSFLKMASPESYNILLESANGNIKNLRSYWSFADFDGGSLLMVTMNEPDTLTRNLLRRFANVFGLAYRRFADLKQAEAQAREAQIETALERIRSRSMAMHKSEELKDVIQLVFEQFVRLGLPVEHTGFILDYKNREDYESWIADRLGSPSGITIPYFDAIYYNRFNEAKKTGLDFFTVNLSREEKNKFYNDLFQHLPNFPDSSKEYLLEQPALTLSTALLDSVALYIENFSGTPFTEEENAVLMRVGRVFQQAYTRFLDLQKAEAQAREAEIQLALERVRARTMAMQKQTDLFDLVYAFGEQLVALGLKVDYVSFINGTITKDRDWDLWGCNPNLKLPGENNLIPHKEIAYFTKTAESIRNYEKTGNPIQIKSFTKNEKDEFFDHYFSHASVPEDFKQYLYNAPGSSIVDAFLGEVTVSICRYDLEPYSEEQLAIFNRFSKEFRQAYIRFLDLQKAEAQAREAQIEAALEKVRSRTMAMQSSEELADAAFVLFEQLNQLGVAHERINIGIVNEEDRVIDFWVTSQGGNRISTRFSGRLSEPTTISKAYSAWKNGEKSLVIDLRDDDLKEWLRYLQEEIKIPFDHKYLHDRRVQTAGFFSKGMLVVTSPEPLPAEAVYLLEKFAGVFDLTYTRFNDLKLAEAQTRAAKIETALERVRARALAMQEPEELADVARVMRQEMGWLGVEELETSSIFIHDEERGHTECWYAIRDIRAAEPKLLSDHFKLELPATRVGRQMQEYFQSAETRTSIVMKGEDRREWLRYCERQSPPLQGYYGEEIPDRHYHLHKFSHGAIGAASAGDISSESWELLQRASSVFSLAYSRFKDLTQARIDLQRLKEEKQRAETALSELKATQKQLIQSEKMASLGELTAGIAHEIQNPLNFVNNFSEVSKELLDEMKEELEKGQLDLAREIMEDVIQNLEKINHHGKRADGIVKGMLQHSRSSSGQKETTDINALCDEYLRLAYHGLRAKDKSFNAKFETDLDPAVGKINVLPQDLGRVILNLINNAFYAVSERKKQGLDGYEALVNVSSKRIADKIEIRVQDNGTGIPQKVIDKIFQPFFTTKPTGEGTGLGLSLSYDIITKGHGGTLQVSTREDVGTTFTIQLPA